MSLAKHLARQSATLAQFILLLEDEQRALARSIRSTVQVLTRRGGSHTGDLQVARVPGAACPRCSAPLDRRTVGGRTTYSCPQEQT